MNVSQKSQTIRCTIVTKTVAVVLVCQFILVGCAQLSERVVDKVESGAVIAHSCQAISDAYPIPMENIEDYFKVRLQFRFTGCTTLDQQECGADRHVILSDLEGLVDRWKSTVEYAKTNSQLRNAVAKLEGISSQFDGLKRNVKQRTELIRGKVDAMIKKLGELKPGDCTFRTQCAERLAGLLMGSKDLLGEIESELKATRSEVTELWNELASLPDELREDARSSRVLREAESLVLGLAEFLKKGLGIISASGDYRLSVKPIIDDLFYGYVSYEIADNALMALDRLLKPVERTIDRADEHAYGLISLGLFLADAELQGLVEAGLKKRSAKIFSALNKRQKKLSLELSFARASCARLVDASGENLESPFLAQNLHRMFITLGQEKLDRVSIVDDSQNGQAEKSVNGVHKGLLIAKIKADSDTGYSELSPVTRNIFDRATISGRTEWEVDKHGRGTDRAKSITSSVCGKYLGDLDFERFQRLSVSTAAEEINDDIKKDRSKDRTKIQLSAEKTIKAGESMDQLTASGARLKSAIEGPIKGSPDPGRSSFYGERISGSVSQSAISEQVRSEIENIAG